MQNTIGKSKTKSNSYELPICNKYDRGFHLKARERFTSLLVTLAFLILGMPIFSQIANANLFLTPSSNSINPIVNTPQNFTINIQNNNTFIIYNVSLVSTKSYLKSSLVDKIEANQTATLQIQALTNNQFTESFNGIIQFYYILDIPQTPKTYNIYINALGYSPKDIEILKDDSIQWINNHTTSMTITSPPLFDQLLATNETFTYTPTAIGEILYFNQVFGTAFNGKIITRERILGQQVHNPDFDVLFPITVNSKFVTTSLSLELIDSNLTVDYNGINEGLFKITNLGNEEAKNISITTDSNWLSFNKQYFNLNPSQNAFVVYKVIPNIQNANETGKTYSINININSINTDTVTKQLSIIITQANFSQPENFSLENARKLVEEFRKEIERLKLSLGNESTKIIYLIEEFPVNVTKGELNRALDGIQGVRDELTTESNARKEDRDYFNNITDKKLTEAINLSASALNNSDKALNISQDNERNTSISIVIIIVVIIVLAGGFYIVRNWEKKRITDRELRG